MEATENAHRCGRVRDHSGVVVANPGHMNWLAHSAVAAAQAHALASYVTPLGHSPADVDEIQSRFGRAANPVVRELRRRIVPDAIPRDLVTRVASGAEARAVVARRLGLPTSVVRLMADRRDRAFDRSLAHFIPPDISALHTAYGASLAALVKARSLGIPSALEFAVDHHGFTERILQQEARLQPEYARTLQFHRPSTRRKGILDAEIEAADSVVALSEFSRRTFADQGVEPDAIRVNQLGVDASAFRPGARADDGVFRVLFVGVFTQRKGLSYLVDGFRRAGIPGSELVLTGSVWGGATPWREVPGVRERAWLGHTDLVAAYRSSDVFVLPALSEGFGRVVLEAMACGLPVIVSANTGAADAVRDGQTGYVIPIRDSGAIAERLRTLWESPELRAVMGRRARDTAEAFSWAAYGARASEMLGIA